MVLLLYKQINGKLTCNCFHKVFRLNGMLNVTYLTKLLPSATSVASNYVADSFLEMNGGFFSSYAPLSGNHIA